MARLSSAATFLISLALHAGLVMWVEVGGSTTPSEAAPEIATPPDVWTGRGIDPLALEREVLIPIEPGAVPIAPPADERGDCSACPPAAPAASPSDPAKPLPIEPRPQKPIAALKPSQPENAVATERRRPPPKPRPAAKPTTRERAASPPEAPSTPSPSGPAATAASAGAESSGAENAPRAAYGAEGLPIGVRHLPTAFWRALPVASYRIAPFQTLPPGKLGEARFELAVDEDGKLGEPTFESAEAEAEVPPAIRRMIDNTMILLRAGRFSLDPNALSAGTLRLRLVVEISDREPDPDATGDGHMKSLGRHGDPPRPGRPGQVAFTLNSGRHVDAWLHLEP